MQHVSRLSSDVHTYPDQASNNMHDKVCYSLDIWFKHLCNYSTYAGYLDGYLHRNTARLWPRDRRQRSTGSGATWAAMDGWNGKGDATRNGSEDQPQWSHGPPEWQFDPTVFPIQVDSEFKAWGGTANHNLRIFVMVLGWFKYDISRPQTRGLQDDVHIGEDHFLAVPLYTWKGVYNVL